MIKRTRIAFGAVLSLLLALVLTACGPSAETAVSPTTAVVATTAAPAATTAASATTAAAAGAATTAASGAATTAAAAVTTAAAAAGAGTGDIRIGVMGPFTGPNASFGTAIKRGITMATDEINKAGGISGRKIVLIERDDKGNPNEGVTIIRDLIEKEKVLALIGTANSSVGVNQAPIVQQSKLPWVIPVTTGSKITEEPGNPSYIFRVSMVDRFQTSFAADYALTKYKKIAIIHDDTAYGTLGKDDLLKFFSAKSLTPAAVISYKIGATSDEMKPMINQIKAASPDVLINWGLGAEATNIKKAMKDLSVDTPMIGSWGLSQPTFQQGAGELANGVIVPQTFAVDTTIPKQVEFITRYKAEYKTEQVGFPSGLAQSYDAMRMLGDALKAPGAADSKDTLRTALENLAGYDGIIKKYEKPFSNQFHEAFTDKDFFMTVWEGDKMVRLK